MKVTYNVMQERWETPPDDEEDEQKHSPYCRCDDCEAYEADRYYDMKKDEEYEYDS